MCDFVALKPNRTRFYDDNIIFESDSYCDIALSTFLSSSSSSSVAAVVQLNCFRSFVVPIAMKIIFIWARIVVAVVSCRILIEIELKFTSIDLSSLLHIYSFACLLDARCDCFCWHENQNLCPLLVGCAFFCCCCIRAVGLLRCVFIHS